MKWMLSDHLTDYYQRQQVSLTIWLNLKHLKGILEYNTCHWKILIFAGMLMFLWIRRSMVFHVVKSLAFLSAEQDSQLLYILDLDLSVNLIHTGSAFGVFS